MVTSSKIMKSGVSRVRPGVLFAVNQLNLTDIYSVAARNVNLKTDTFALIINDQGLHTARHTGNQESTVDVCSNCSGHSGNRDVCLSSQPFDVAQRAADAAIAGRHDNHSRQNSGND